MSNWYKKFAYAPESTSTADASIGSGDITAVRDFKQWPQGTTQGLNGVGFNGTGLESSTQSGSKKEGQYGIEVTNCGEEPGIKRGCGLPIANNGNFHDYSVEINGKKYRAYKCNNCGHSLKPFNISYSKHPDKLKKKRKRKRVKRLSFNVTRRTVEAQSGAPYNPMSGGGYNNLANTPLGRTDLSNDLRMIPWDKIEPDFDEYDDQKQKNNKKYKIIKTKGSDGKDKYIKLTLVGNDFVMPSNVFNEKGRRKKQPRYNPADGKDGEGHGAWPHNRDPNKGWYQNTQSNAFDADFRQRVTPWSDYIRERNTSLLTLTKPY